MFFFLVLISIMTIEQLALILTAFGVGSILLEIVKGYIARKKQEREDKKEKQKEKNSFKNVINSVNEIYETLINLVSYCNASRVVVLKTTNGGGRPTLSGNLYSSVIYEAFDSKLGGIKEHWQNQLLDKAYMSMLKKMQDNQGFLEIKTEDLEDGLLKVLYLKEGIQKSLVYEIKPLKNCYIYLSVNFTNLNEGKDVETKELLRHSVTALRTIFEEDTFS